MYQIAPRVEYYTRAEWGADPQYPRLGGPDDPRNPGNWIWVPESMRTEAIHHHTVTVDLDPTPNLWTNLGECFDLMRRLQVGRPDLGLDVPYNFVLFMMEDGRLVACEGRGARRAGAHTRGHNLTGIACAIAGNLEMFVNLVPFIDPLSWVWGWIKYDLGLTQLGSVHPANGDIFGHLDFATTACPGRWLMASINRIGFVKYQAQNGEDEDMLMIVREEGSPYVWITNGVSRTYLRDKRHSDALGIPWNVKVVPKGTLASVARLDDLT